MVYLKSGMLTRIIFLLRFLKLLHQLGNTEYAGLDIQG